MTGKSESNQIEYFDTPERASCIDYVSRELEKQAPPIYIRGVPGIGKSRMAQRLEAKLGNEIPTVLVVINPMTSLRVALYSELGIPPDEGSDWAQNLMGKLGIGKLLLIVDDVHLATQPDIESIVTLQQHGVQVVFFGEGSLREPNPLSDLQFLNIPRLTKSQIVDFLHHLGIAEKDLYSVSRIQQQTDGVPGRLKTLVDSGRLRSQEIEHEGQVAGGWIVWSIPLILAFGAAVGWYLYSNLESPPPPRETSNTAGIGEPSPAPIPTIPPLIDVEEPIDPGRPQVADLAEPPPEAMKPSDFDRPIAEALLAELGQAEVAEPIPPAQEPERHPDARDIKTFLPVPVEVSDTVEAEGAAELALSQSAPVREEGGAALSIDIERDRLWLLGQNPQNFTIQLVGTRELSSIQSFVERHQISPPYAVFVRDEGGADWYSLVSGSYPDLRAAREAVGQLPPSLQGKGAWARELRGIQSSLKIERPQR